MEYMQKDCTAHWNLKKIYNVIYNTLLAIISTFLLVVVVLSPELCPRDTAWKRCGWATGWGLADSAHRWNRACTLWWARCASSPWAGAPRNTAHSRAVAWTWSLRGDRLVGSELWTKQEIRKARNAAGLLGFICWDDAAKSYQRSVNVECSIWWRLGSYFTDSAFQNSDLQRTLEHSTPLFMWVNGCLESLRFCLLDWLRKH